MVTGDEQWYTPCKSWKIFTRLLALASARLGVNSRNGSPTKPKRRKYKDILKMKRKVKMVRFPFFLSSHYSKSQIFVQKLNFDKTLTFSRVFHQIFFWQFFSWNQSCQQLKSPKPQLFNEFFYPPKSTIFLGNQSWIFGQKMKISNSVFRNDFLQQDCKNFVVL